MGLVGAVGYRRVIDLLFQQEQLLRFDVGGGTVIPIEHIDESKGGVDAFSLSLAGKANPKVAFGINLNFLTGSVDDTDIVQVAFGGEEVFVVEQRTVHDVGGLSAEFGARIQVLPRLTVGGILRPGYNVDLDRGRGVFRQFVVEGAPVPAENIFIQGPVPGLTREIPTFYGIGITGTPSTGWVLAADFQYRPWNESLDTIRALNGQTFIVDRALYAAHSVHVGAEYTFYRDRGVQVPLRLGFHTHPTSLANVDSLSNSVGVNGLRSYRGDRVEGNTWSGGLGLHFQTVDFDISLDRTSLSVAEFSEYFPSPPIPGQALRVIEIEETINNLYFSSTLKF